MQAPPGGGSPRLTTAREWSLSSAVECVSATAPPTRLLAELFAEADETLFKNILHIKAHVLHQLLTDRTQSTYNLRSRKHECSLTVKHSLTANEFLTRMLYKDMYYSVINYQEHLLGHIVY